MNIRDQVDWKVWDRVEDRTMARITDPTWSNVYGRVSDIILIGLGSRIIWRVSSRAFEEINL